MAVHLAEQLLHEACPVGTLAQETAQEVLEHLFRDEVVVFSQNEFDENEGAPAFALLSLDDPGQTTLREEFRSGDGEFQEVEDDLETVLDEASILAQLAIDRRVEFLESPEVALKEVVQRVLALDSHAFHEHGVEDGAVLD